MENTESASHGWIGVDLDGTLAHYTEWRGPEHIGEPIPAMVERVRGWLAEGREVRIFTARVACDGWERVKRVRAIAAWCRMHLGQELEVTCTKDMHMIELWDDRAVTVAQNTGEQLSPSTRGLGSMLPPGWSGAAWIDEAQGMHTVRDWLRRITKLSVMTTERVMKLERSARGIATSRDERKTCGTCDGYNRGHCVRSDYHVQLDDACSAWAARPDGSNGPDYDSPLAAYYGFAPPSDPPATLNE